MRIGQWWWWRRYTVLLSSSQKSFKVRRVKPMPGCYLPIGLSIPKENQIPKPANLEITILLSKWAHLCSKFTWRSFSHASTYTIHILQQTLLGSKVFRDLKLSFNISISKIEFLEDCAFINALKWITRFFQNSPVLEFWFQLFLNHLWVGNILAYDSFYGL